MLANMSHCSIKSLEAYFEAITAMNSVMKTRQKWLKMSKVVIAWTIWTKGQIGGQKMLN